MQGVINEKSTLHDLGRVPELFAHVDLSTKVNQRLHLETKNAMRWR